MKQKFSFYVPHFGNVTMSSCSFSDWNKTDSGTLGKNVAIYLNKNSKNAKFDFLNVTVNFNSPLAPIDRANFITRLGNVQEWWHCNRSEMARRTYIDQFIYCGLTSLQTEAGKVKDQLIITSEESISQAEALGSHYMGWGSLDYLVSCFDASKNVILIPSLIIEAKKEINPTKSLENQGENQLISELVTTWQKGGLTKQQAYHFYRGILTDGRYWCFYELTATAVYRTQIFDANKRLPNDDFDKIMGTLFRMLRYYDSTSALLTTMKSNQFTRLESSFRLPQQALLHEGRSYPPVNDSYAKAIGKQGLFKTFTVKQLSKVVVHGLTNSNPGILNADDKMLMRVKLQKELSKEKYKNVLSETGLREIAEKIVISASDEMFGINQDQKMLTSEMVRTAFGI